MSGKFDKYNEWKESLVIGKNPCYRCRKHGRDKDGNNFHYYGEEQGGNCFSSACDFKILSKELIEELELDDDNDYEEELEMADKFSRTWWKKFRQQLSFDCKGWRGISRTTNKVYGVMYEYDTESEKPKLLAQHCPTTYNYKIAGLKTRKLPKDFHALGVVGKNAEMFGQHRFKDATGRFVVITAGEIDCLSAYQILEEDRKRKGSKFNPIPVVSPTAGEGGVSQVRNQYEWLDRFDRIVVCFDNDSAGKKALDKISRVLPQGKMYVMNLSRNDTNEYIWDGKKKVDHKQEWISSFWNAQKYTPSGIIGSGVLAEKVREYVNRPKIPLPDFLEDLQKMTAGGFPLGQIINIASASGTGKSTIVDELTYYWMFNSSYKLGVLSFEAESGKYGVNILSRHIRQKIELCESPEEAMEILNDPEIQKKERDLWLDENNNHRIHIIEDRGMNIDHVKKLINELIIRCGCQQIIIDPIQDLLDKVTLAEQAEFTDWLKDMTKSHRVTFILVNHVRKSGSGMKANSAGGDMNEEDIRGSSTLFNSAAFNIILMRNKEQECEVERNTTYVKVTKARGPGNTGMAGEIYYDNRTHTLLNRKKIPGMPIGRLPAPDRNGEVIDERPRVGKDGSIVKPKGAPPEEPTDLPWEVEE